MIKNLGACGSCQKELSKTVCDWCGQEIRYGVPAVLLTFNYSSKFDGDNFQFCRDKCFIDYTREVVHRKWLEYVEKGNCVSMEWEKRVKL